MARTLVGQLILKLVDQMSGPAKGAAQSLNQVTAAAKGLNGAGAAGAAGMDRLAKSMKDVNDRANAANIRGWSLSFEKTLARLKVSAEEMQLVKASWNDLQNAFAREKISGSLKSIRIAEWRNATVAHLMGVRTALDQTGAAAANMGSRTANELNKVGAAARKSAIDVNKLKNVIGVAVAGGAGAYLGGFITRAAFVAPASVEQERFRMRASGVGAKDSADFENRAGALAGTYGALKSDLMGVFREAALGIPNTRDDKGNITSTGIETAKYLAEPLAQFTAIMENIHGPGTAAAHTRSMMKTFDVLGIADPERIRKNMDSIARMNRILGADFDPRQMHLAAKYMRASGKVLDDDFMFSLAPAMIAESAGSDLGTSTRAWFDATVGGRMSKRARAEFSNYGLLDEKGNVKGQEMMNRPDRWINEILKPILAQKGVDVKDDVKLAGILTRLFDNRLSSDMAYKLVSQLDQYRDIVERAENAMGLEGAKMIPKEDPFKNFNALINSLKNLSAAVLGPSFDTIMKGLGGLADGINALANALNGAPGLASGLVSLAATIVVLAGALKLALGAVAVARGVAAIPALANAIKGAAPAAAAAAGGATTAASAAAAGGAASRLPSMLRFGAPLAMGGALLGVAGMLHEDEKRFEGGPLAAHNNARNRRRAINERLHAETQAVKAQVSGGGISPEAFIAAESRSAETGQKIKESPNVAVKPQVSDGGISPEAFIAAESRSAEAGQKIKENLNVTVKPQADLSSLLSLDSLLTGILGKLASIGPASAGAASAARVNLNNAYSDFGVSP